MIAFCPTCDQPFSLLDPRAGVSCAADAAGAYCPLCRTFIPADRDLVMDAMVARGEDRDARRNP